jgi:hypothetical protein
MTRPNGLVDSYRLVDKNRLSRIDKTSATPSTWLAWQYRFLYGFLNQSIGESGVAYWFYATCLRVEQRFKPVFLTTLKRKLKTLFRTPNSLSRSYVKVVVLSQLL